MLDIGMALDAVARPETTMHAYLSSRLGAAEGIIDFYVRILNSISFMLNTPHATQSVDVKQLLSIFVVGIQDRPLANTSLVQSMDYHPRTQYAHYEPWDLVWTNYQTAESPRTLPPAQPAQRSWSAAAGDPRRFAYVAAHEAIPVATHPSGQGRDHYAAGRGAKRPRGQSPRPDHGRSPRGFQPSGSDRLPLGTSHPGQGRGADSPRPHKATRREALADSVPAFSTLSPALQATLKELRRACMAPARQELSAAKIQEVDEVHKLYGTFRNVASQEGVPHAFCFTCKRWGHPTNSAVCRAGSR